MGSYIKTVLLIIILLFFITFGVKNSQPVQLTYYFNAFNASVPLYGLGYVSLLIGIIAGIMIGFRSRYRLRKKIRSMERDFKELNANTKYDRETEKEDENRGRY